MEVETTSRKSRPKALIATKCNVFRIDDPLVTLVCPTMATKGGGGGGYSSEIGHFSLQTTIL